jgi:hypothetical protein
MSSFMSNRQGTSPYPLGRYAPARLTVRLSDNTGSAASAAVAAVAAIAAYLKAVKHPLFGDLPIHSR